jgi:hypothetical protein
MDRERRTPPLFVYDNKIEHFLSLKFWPQVKEFIPVQYETLVRRTSDESDKLPVLDIVVQRIEKLTNLQRDCITNADVEHHLGITPYEPIGLEFDSLDANYVEWMNAHLDWDVEATIGYTPSDKLLLPSISDNDGGVKAYDLQATELQHGSNGDMDDASTGSAISEPEPAQAASLDMMTEEANQTNDEDYVEANLQATALQGDNGDIDASTGSSTSEPEPDVGTAQAASLEMTAEEANQQTNDEDYVKAYLQATEVQGGSDIDASTGSDISEPEPDVRRLQAAASLEMMTAEANEQTHDEEDYVKAYLQAT